MDPQNAMALIALLGNDEQVGDASGAGSDTSRYNFIVADEVVPFFVLLRDFIEEYLSQSNLETHGDKIVIDRLKAISASCERNTGSMGRHLLKKIPNRGAGGGAAKGVNYVC